jgi:hypothetical protein
MRIPQSYVQKCKVVAHIFQAIFVFVAACLTIAVMTKDGDIGGPTKYFFAMVRLSLYPNSCSDIICAVRYQQMDVESQANTTTVFPIHTRNNIPHHGSSMVARPTLRICLRFSGCRRRLHHPLVCRLHRSRYMEQRGYKEGR